jgi:hypothetical protein
MEVAMQLEQLQHIMASRAIAFSIPSAGTASAQRFTSQARAFQLESIDPGSARASFQGKGNAAEQRAAAEALLQFSLSEVGYQKRTTSCNWKTSAPNRSLSPPATPTVCFHYLW